MKLKKPIKFYVMLYCFVMAIAFMGGCAEPPKQEVDAANAALLAAVTAGAEQYAAGELKAAQDLLAKLNAAMEKKDYKAAKGIAIQLKEAADKAKAVCEDGKTKAKEAAVAFAGEVKQGLEKVKALVAEAEKAKLPVDLLQPIREQFAAAQAGANELDGMVSAEKFKEAADKGGQLKDQFTQIEQGINDAKAKVAAAIKAAATKKLIPKKK